MSPAPFDMTAMMRPDVPAPAVRYTGFPKFNFVGGHNDPESTPVEALVEAATTVLRREGHTLATYGLASGPQGYLGLREFLVERLGAYAGLCCTVDDLLITSGSLQGLDLVNRLLVAPGDTVLIEEDCYGGVISRLKSVGAKIVGMPLDKDGIRVEAVAESLERLAAEGVRPKFIYTIPTIQNPTASILPPERRKALIALAQKYGVPIVEDECYSDLVFAGSRPAAIKGMTDWPGIIHIGSFSKSIAPALRVGYVVAGWDVISRMLAMKSDGGTGALEQMVLAEFCKTRFVSHVAALNKVLEGKLATLTGALAEQFGTAAEFEAPKGGIFLWVKLPEGVDTQKLFQAAGKAGIAINPGPEWSIAAPRNARQLRLCFAHPSHEQIRAGVAALAEVCHKEMGVPARIANVSR
jgi:2-aminoadipate transaminase